MPAQALNSLLPFFVFGTLAGIFQEQQPDSDLDISIGKRVEW